MNTDVGWILALLRLVRKTWRSRFVDGVCACLRWGGVRKAREVLDPMRPEPQLTQQEQRRHRQRHGDELSSEGAAGTPLPTGIEVHPLTILSLSLSSNFILHWCKQMWSSRGHKDSKHSQQ